IPSGAESQGTSSRFESARASLIASATVACSGNSTFHSHCSSRVAYATTQRLRAATLLIQGSRAGDERIDERRSRLLEEGLEEHRRHRIAEREAHLEVHAAAALTDR